ncbi:DUF1266 domain-containing protein [Algoriphagus sp.]|uniref:DUF1266 domain-containing protein n=1 Tax=Algoriphagus sp. TaxID=1872435 RepID=UPI0026071EB6|nr:DUF1266 domain-containing protein [Algoriphagus sp.]
MQMFDNMPWYGYIILALAIASYAYKYFNIGKKEYDKPDLEKAKFKKSSEENLGLDRLFSLALFTPISEWWGASTNTLTFRDAKTIQPYLEGWGIDSPSGYWDLTEYFMKDGRRWYFDFIFQMIQAEPKENWNKLMDQKFGTNERAQKYLDLLSSGEVLNDLKQKGIFSFDSDMELSLAGYDAGMLVGQARIAFTGNIISEEEAWKVIDFATKLALDKFSSWEDFGKSFALGFALDMKGKYDNYYQEVCHIYKQVLNDKNSPWNTINWPN